MANEIDITVKANETASDAMGDVGDAAKRTEKVVVSSMANTETAFDSAARESGKFAEGMDLAEGFTGRLADGVSGVGEAVTAFQDAAHSGARRAIDLARAQQDVEQAAADMQQAIEDAAQAERDSNQAFIDGEQAAADNERAIYEQEKAYKAYNDAVKKHGKNSDEAKEALLDYNDAGLEVLQTEEDMAQADRDAQQAKLDATQATIDQKGATTDLAEATTDLGEKSSVLGQMSQWTGILTGVLGGLSGIIGTVTAVQWAWNAAMNANPIGIVITIIGLLIGAIVLIATKTDWFQKLWHWIWGKIGDPVKAVWNWIKNFVSASIDVIGGFLGKIPSFAKKAFSSLVGLITSPFRSAFNGIARLWNSTIGRLSFSIPSWVPGIGGASFSAPKIPQLAVGGDVLRGGLAQIHAGERLLDAASVQRLDRLGMQSGAGMGALVKVLLELDISGAEDPNTLEGIVAQLLKRSLKVKKVIDDGIRATVASSGQGSVQTAYGR